MLPEPAQEWLAANQRARDAMRELNAELQYGAPRERVIADIFKKLPAHYLDARQAAWRYIGYLQKQMPGRSTEVIDGMVEAEAKTFGLLRADGRPWEYGQFPGDWAEYQRFGNWACALVLECIDLMDALALRTCRPAEASDEPRSHKAMPGN